MKFLADENFPLPTVAALVALGHDVATVQPEVVGKPDEFVLKRAQAENRIVITCDKGFGELAFKRGLPATSGVVLFRLTTTSLAEFTARVVMALSVSDQWIDRFVVVQDARVRIRPMNH